MNVSCCVSNIALCWSHVVPFSVPRHVLVGEGYDIYEKVQNIGFSQITHRSASDKARFLAKSSYQ